MPVAISDLPQIAFSRNPVNVAISSDDYISVAGVAAVIAIQFKAAVVAGKQIPLLWAGADLTLEANAGPDESANQFLPGAGDAAYVQSLIPVFEGNYYINRDFVLSYSLSDGFPSVIFTAIQTGVLYNVSQVDDAVIGVKPVTAGVNEELQTSFAHHLEVWLKQAGVFGKIYDENLQLDFPTTGVTTKDISNILHPYLCDGSDRPDLSLTGWQACYNSLQEYYVKFAQYFGASPAVKKIRSTSSAFINRGGLSVNSALGQTMAGYLRPGAIDSNTLCLRQGSKVKTIQVEQPEWLYWINLTGAAIDIRIRIEMFFTTGGSSSFIYAPQTAQPWQKYYIAVGYNALNIAAAVPNGARCAYYTARLVSSAGGFLSAEYTYVIDRFREWPRYFVFLNSLGGYQTVYTYGKMTPETDRTKEDIKKQVPYATAAISGGFLENNIRIQDKYTVNTGYTSKRDNVLLKDFFASPDKFYLYQGRLIPIGLDTDTLQLAKDGDLNFASFQFYPLYDEVVFTDDSSLPDNSINSPGSSAGAPEAFNAIWDDDDNEGNDTYYDL